MGADLYIEKLYKPCVQKNRRNFKRWCMKRASATGQARQDLCQKKVNLYYNKMYERGYFRDSYNSSSLFWQLGLSWWRDVSQESGLLDSSNNLTPEKAQVLRDLVASKPLPVHTTESLKAMRATVDDDNTVESWNKYFADSKKEFLDFLDEAIRLREPIHCSL